MRAMNATPRIAVFLLAAFFFSLAAHAAQGRLGFTVDFSADRKLLDADLKRIVVTRVAPASPAERAGMQAGDVLDQFNGKPLAGSSARKFFDAVGRIKPGDKVALVVLRGDKPVPLTLVAE